MRWLRFPFSMVFHPFGNSWRANRGGHFCYFNYELDVRSKADISPPARSMSPFGVRTDIRRTRVNVRQGLKETGFVEGVNVAIDTAGLTISSIGCRLGG